MKRSFLGASLSIAVIAMILSCAASAQTTFLDENFDSVAGGTTPPANWTTFNTLSPLLFSFDNPGGVGLSGFTGGVAGIDSDDFGSGFTHNAFLQSPDVDVSGAATLRLAFKHYVRGISGQVTTAQVFDGTVYNVAFTGGGADIGSGAAPVSELFDVTALAGGATNANIQFRYEGDFDWWWFIDDVMLFEPATLPGQAPRPGMSVFNINNAINANSDPVSSGANGPYGTTIDPGTTMNMTWEGSANFPVSCFYGALNPISATFPGGIGQTDVGGPALDINGYPVGIGVFADGIGFAGAPGSLSLDAFFFCDPAGMGGISLPFPSFGVAPGTVLTTFQCTMASPAAPFFYLSNAVTVTTN